MREIPAALRIALWPFSLLYGAAVIVRAWLYKTGWLKQKRLKGVVISVGNITVGGTGKTPMVIWLAEKFLAEGKRVAILSRGYRGSDGTSDEVELMKERLQGRVLFGVGKNRYEAGRRLESQGIDVFLLDDGFQHLQLARDLDIVLVDTSRPLRQQSLLPAGPKREPGLALHRADIVVFTRVESQTFAKWAIQKFPQFPIFPASTQLLGCRKVSGDKSASTPYERVLDPAFCFCGIGNPKAFLDDLDRWGLKIVGLKLFRDHHSYDDADIRKLERAARSVGARVLLTTEKDVKNLRSVTPSEMPIYYCEIAMDFPDERPFLQAIKSKLQARRVATA